MALMIIWMTVLQDPSADELLKSVDMAESSYVDLTVEYVARRISSGKPTKELKLTERTKAGVRRITFTAPADLDGVELLTVVRPVRRACMHSIPL